MGITLFLDAGHGGLNLGITDSEQWLSIVQKPDSVVDHLAESVRTCLVESGVDWPDLDRIYFLDGPGSTMGIRTICALLKTLVLFEKIEEKQIFVTNHLYFYQAYCSFIQPLSMPFYLMAKSSLQQCLTLFVEDKSHFNPILKMTPQTKFKYPCFLLPHPSLAKNECLHYDLKGILPLLTLEKLPLWNPANDSNIWSHSEVVRVNRKQLWM